MDEKKKVPEEGPNGVDRWTNNGYGMMLDGKPVTPIGEDENSDIDIDEIEEIEE